MHTLKYILAATVYLAVLVISSLVVLDIVTAHNREERFMDECQWAPAVTQPDGSTTARTPRNPYPLCYLELVKAKTLTTTVQFIPPAVNASGEVAPPAPAPGLKK